MIHWIEAMPDGRIVASGMGNTEPVACNGGTIHKAGALHHPNECLFVDGQVIEFGAAPSASHRLDPALRRWVCDDVRAWALARCERDRRLVASDWITLRAQEQGQAVPPAWLAYRQALRDITEQPDPTTILWPTLPSN